VAIGEDASVYRGAFRLDDMRGEKLLHLEARVRRLESEIARLNGLVEALRPRG
jgi:hypothetical protein